MDLRDDDPNYCLFHESFDSDSDTASLQSFHSASDEWVSEELELAQMYKDALQKMSPKRPPISLNQSGTSSITSLQASFLEFMRQNAVPGLPRYFPPLKTTLEAMKQMCRLYHVPEQPPAPPQMPLAKTNTAMCNYVHRVYIYRSFWHDMIYQKREAILRVQNARIRPFRSAFLHQ